MADTPAGTGLVQLSEKLPATWMPEPPADTEPLVWMFPPVTTILVLEPATVSELVPPPLQVACESVTSASPVVPPVFAWPSATADTLAVLPAPSTIMKASGMVCVEETSKAETVPAAV